MAEPLLADAPPRPRHCAGCQHVHGGRAFGVCLVTDCPCVAVSDKSARRQRCRLAAKAFAALSPEQLALYQVAARRAADSDLTLEEFALEYGFDQQLLWRARRSLRLNPPPANHQPRALRATLSRPGFSP